MNQVNIQTKFHDVEEQQREEFSALTAEELQLIAGGECVVNQV